MTYIDARGAEALKEYQYSGSDASLIYKYFHSPLAQWFVDHCTPVWLAPNTITVMGLALVIASHQVSFYYLPELSGEAPSWVYVMAAASLLVYMVLDNMDGKQARKTGNSSPLGLIFDHGCDALNTVISAATVSATVQFGASWETLVLLISSLTAFYIATWEEYYTGTLALPIINGPNEGVFVIIAIHLSAAIFGPSIWLADVGYGLRLHHLFLIATVVMTVVTVIGNVDNVLNAVVRDNEDVSSGRKAFFSGALMQLFAFLGFMALVLAAHVFSPCSLMASFPRMFPWAVGLVACKLTVSVMLAHLTDTPLNVYGKTLFLSVFVVCHLLLDESSLPFDASVLPFHGHPLEVTPECCSATVQALLIISAVSFAHMIVGVIGAMTSILGIRVFHVKPVEDGKAKRA